MGKLKMGWESGIECRRLWVFNIEHQLDLDIRGLIIALRMNLEMGPWFAEVCFAPPPCYLKLADETNKLSVFNFNHVMIILKFLGGSVFVVAEHIYVFTLGCASEHVFNAGALLYY